MEDKRAQTLEALDLFIKTQRALLSTTQSDITRLGELKRHIVRNPDSFLDNKFDLSDLSSSSDTNDLSLSFLENLSWPVFEGCDPTSMQEFALRKQQELSQRNQPSSSQSSPLSDLQKFVKRARSTILEPVLASLGPISDVEEDVEEEINSESLKRQREREKIREIKKRKIQSCGLTLPSRSIGVPGVFIRHDLEDESMDVDISLDDDKDSSLHPPKHFDPSPQMPLSVPTRSRSPTVHERHPSLDDKEIVNSYPRRKLKNVLPSPVNAGQDNFPAKTEIRTKPIKASSKPIKESNKPKPETYKQAWSVSEQHILERLLEQIPEGEKFRWQKISRAMDGKRTPRQVASRVQKYFEKLKRFGVELNGETNS